jgi:4-hydroxy-2,2'-bipyrrole-5-carbaldehyde O-methyltransferase
MRYSLEAARTGLRLRHKRAHGLLVRDFGGWLRVEFLGSAARTGLLAALGRGARTLDDLADALGGADRDLLASLLEVGVAVGVLRRSRGGSRWRLAGARARAMVDPAVDGLAALPEEAVMYGADVYRHVGDRLAGAPPGDYLAEHAELVARTSRVAEPIFSTLVADVVRDRRPRRVLDIGCGSGVYLRTVAEAAPTASGVGVDLAADVVSLARRNLTAWGLAGRFPVHQADVRDLPDDLDGPWDLVLLFQNIYYFAPADRPAVLAGLRRLAPDGALVVGTAVRGTGDPAAAHLDLVLRSTAGSVGLPTAAEMRDALDAAGFAAVDERRLAPLQPLRGFVAT